MKTKSGNDTLKKTPKFFSPGKYRSDMLNRLVENDKGIKMSATIVNVLMVFASRIDLAAPLIPVTPVSDSLRNSALCLRDCNLI
jgi:hypothetical protein